MAELVFCLVINIKDGTVTQPQRQDSKEKQEKGERNQKNVHSEGKHPQCLERHWATRTRRVNLTTRTLICQDTSKCPPSPLYLDRARPEPKTSGRALQHSKEMGLLPGQSGSQANKHVSAYRLPLQAEGAACRLRLQSAPAFLRSNSG